MIVSLSIKMFNILLLCPVLLVAGVQTLTIDSQLGTSIEDCFERISIAEQLPADAIYCNVTELTTRECEQICRQDKQCQSYDYGVGAKGNATCDLSKTDEKLLKEKNLLLRHPDYDVYVRRFQCEQSPPSPIQPQFDDPSDEAGPIHRPVFRPVDDQKQPFSDDYLISGDLESYGVARPVYKPQYNERPDDYAGSKPEFDEGPSYGAHKPQDIPYRPEKPSHNGSHSTRPDPYDVLQLQDPYRPNNRPGYPLNDYERPRPPNELEKPEYHYIVRPNRKPRPQADPGYNKPASDYPVRPGYGQADSAYVPSSVGSKPYPNKEPYDRPRPGYEGSTSGYGQSPPYDDNSIHVEIKDPPRPYKPPKPTYGQGIYGYGTYSSQNSYAQSQSSQSQYYGSSHVLADNGYGSSSSYRPDPRPEMPSYNEPSDTGYGGGSKPQPGYGNSKPPYSNDRPTYGADKPSYGNDRPSYGSEKPSYANDRPSYGSESPSYANDRPTYGVEKPSYGNDKPYPANDRPSYGSEKPSYVNDRPSNGDEKPAYGSDRPSYGNNKPAYGNDSPSYGNDRPSYGNDKPSYGSDKPAYGSDRPSYGNNKPIYGNDSPSYGNDRPSYGNDKPSYGSDKPAYGSDRPSYGNNKPAYGNDSPSYGNDRPSYGNDKPSYGSDKPVYGSDRPSYGNDSPSYGNDKPTYGNDKPSYGATGKPTYGERPGHGANRPAYSSEEPSYGNDRPAFGNDNPSYGVEKPSYGPQRPSYGNQVSYGSNHESFSSQIDYNSHHANYNGHYYGNRPYGQQNSGYGLQKPSHDYHRPSYGSTGYGEGQGVYGNNQSLYGSSYNDGQGSYASQASYGGYQGSYGSTQGSYGQGSYDSSLGSYGNSQGSSGSQGYEASQGSYGSQGSYSGNQGVYGSATGSYGSAQSSYGTTQSSQNSNTYDTQGSYGGSTQGSYGGTQGSGSVSSDYNRPSYGSRPSQDKPNYGKPQKPKPTYGNEDSDPGYGNQPGFDENRPDFINPDEPGYGSESDKPAYGTNDRPKTTGSVKPDIKPVYEYELEKPSNVPSYVARPGGDVVTSRPVVVSEFESGYGRNPEKEIYKACFRRVLAGQRALRSHVRKVVPCERLEDCRRECATEKRFPCESFNYRLDRSFRGKGLCELMTKPIEAFDLRRDFVEDKDFDFFELDRNSLEPNCPDTLRGPGGLHSGFLSSKNNRIPDGGEAQSGWRDRYDGFDGRHRDRFNDERRVGYGNRRNDDRFYVPYQINQGLARSDEDQENWGKYGGEYGGYDKYYKDRNDYHKSISHWRISSDVERPAYGVKPLANTNFDYHSLGKTIGTWSESRYGYGSWKRGRWNSSGTSNGLEYGESNYYKPKSHNHHESIDRSDDGITKDCSSRRRPGMSLGTGAIRRALISRNVVECEAACFSEREFKCVSYSYRYSNSHGTDNCFLSERPYRGLELAADSSSDVYAMPQDQGCVTINYKPWVESECFWHVRSGAAVSDAAIRAALTVAGLGACEAECIRAHAFFCRGFSFRFDSPTIGDDLENCILTSSPPTSLENGRGLRPNSGHELYSRGNYGRGCEPALYDDVQHRDEECYLQYDKAAKLAGSAIRGQASVKDEQGCGRACNDAPFRCLSFSFNNIAPPNTDNCLLSEIRLFDLQRGVDYVHSANDWLFAFDLFNGQCWRKVHTVEFDEPAPEIPRPLSTPPIEEPYSVSGPPGSFGGPSGPPGPPGITGLSGPSGPSGPEFIHEHDHDEPPFIPASGPPTGPGFKPFSSIPERPGFKPEYPGSFGPGYKLHYPSSGSHKPYPDPSGPDFKPGYGPGPNLKPEYTGPSGPSFKPDYPGPIGSGFKPAYPPPVNPNLKPGYPAGPSFKPGYLPDLDLKPGFRPVAPPQRPIYRPDSDPPEYVLGKPGYLPEKPGYSPGRRPGYPAPNRPVYDEQRPRPSRPGGKPVYPDRVDKEPISVSWRHYTVSGFPCRAGTTCAQNTVAGHWACEPEGGEIGSWDYCCAPTHRCGYSEGFHKPWCYVGHNEDQWRPCSEKYYPYHQHKVPHPSQAHQHSPGHREDHPPRPVSPRPWQGRPGFSERDVPSPSDPPGPFGPPGPYLSEGDRKYWDDLYKNGPQAYYDKYGNPLPGYSRVPTESRPHIKYSHNYPRPGGGNWLPVPPSNEDGPPPTGLGVPRYWPVAYLHKGPPPNTTYFRYNETQQPTTTTTERYTTNKPSREQQTTVQPKSDNQEKRRDEKKRNMSDYDIVVPETTTIKVKPTTTQLPEVKETVTENITSQVEMVKPESAKIEDTIKGIDDKLDDFSSSIEVIDLDDVKGDKISELKTLEAEERQIEEIGRILASRRGGKLVLDKRSHKDLESKNIAVDRELTEFNFGNRFNVERRGVIQKVSKDDIDRERGIDKSLEVSETSFVRPPRILSTTENIRKAIVNGKVFYDASIREQRDTFLNATRKSKSLRTGDDSKITNLASSGSYGKKIIKPRNVNPVRRVRRVYKKRYNPEEVRRRLLERERSKQEISTENSKKN